jgi:deoxyribonuclease-4
MIRFGPSGNSKSFYEQGYSSSVEMPSWLRKMGLNAYEYNCTKGVKVKPKTAAEIGLESQKNDIFLSVHAPYYINMASTDEKKRENSLRYIMESLHAARIMGAKRIVVHPGSCLGMDRKTALDSAEKLLAHALVMAEEEGLSGINICPEVLGKKNQLGTLDEILHMCELDESLIPTIDFAHIHARTCGMLDSTEAFMLVLDRIEEALGMERMRNIHVHFSKIEFSRGGEKRHVTFDDTGYGPEFSHLAKALLKKCAEPVIICESRGVMAEDALKMKRIYEQVSGDVGR